MGLPKANRLKHPKEFQSVYQQGRRYQSPHLVLRVLSKTDPLGETEPPQFGISVSQKVSKKAVVRNRLKRQIRAVIRPLIPAISTGCKVVVAVKRNAVECNYEHFLRELEELFIKAEIIYGHTRKHLL
ncbi:ribonuclease P protein component [Aphanothece sacrum]|uniref:Ribonuclease P protein component n=1 Tax=Aphanothece sacrum FPU1 TaxID=1920663 RepID=A0A401IMJ6_APHSA|nr:ribonuclease P protein component [Aphanothece sacrum]GBF82466.1 ribonuclease P [Aphanothece sacrum FPU1]GBF84379.1 ribonuclease P [Aphanothece sacrum FPU3]